MTITKTTTFAPNELGISMENWVEYNTEVDETGSVMHQFATMVRAGSNIMSNLIQNPYAPLDTEGNIDWRYRMDQYGIGLDGCTCWDDGQALYGYCLTPANPGKSIDLIRIVPMSNVKVTPYEDFYRVDVHWIGLTDFNYNYTPQSEWWQEGVFYTNTNAFIGLGGEPPAETPGNLGIGMPDWSGWGNDWNTNYGQDERLIISRSSTLSIALTPPGADTAVGKRIYPKVHVYSDPKGEDELFVLDAKNEPSKFQYSPDLQKWYPVPSGGIPIKTGFESIRIILTVGPNHRRVFLRMENIGNGNIPADGGSGGDGGAGGADLAKIFSGWQTTIGITTGGSIIGCGANYSCQMNQPPDSDPHESTLIGTGFVDMMFGMGQHGLAIDPTGAVYHWGENWDGQAGTGDYNGNDVLPGFTAVPVPASKIVACGDYVSGCVTNNNEVYVWGYGYEVPARRKYQPTDITWSSDTQYTPVSILSGVGEIVALSLSGDSGGAVTVDGKLYIFGGGKYSDTLKSTDGSYIPPFHFNNTSDVAGCYAGYDQFAYWTKTGDVYMWGYGYGQIPVKINIPTKVIQVSQEWEEYYALDENGDIWYWKDAEMTAIKQTELGKAKWISFSASKLVYVKSDNTEGYSGYHDTNYSEDTILNLG